MRQPTSGRNQGNHSQSTGNKPNEADDSPSPTCSNESGNSSNASNQTTPRRRRGRGRHNRDFRRTRSNEDGSPLMALHDDSQAEVVSQQRGTRGWLSKAVQAVSNAVTNTAKAVYTRSRSPKERPMERALDLHAVGDTPQHDSQHPSNNGIVPRQLSTDIEHDNGPLDVSDSLTPYKGEGDQPSDRGVTVKVLHLNLSPGLTLPAGPKPESPTTEFIRMTRELQLNQQSQQEENQRCQQEEIIFLDDDPRNNTDNCVPGNADTDKSQQHQ